MSSLGLIVVLLLLAVVLSYVLQSRQPWRGPAEIPREPVQTGVALLLCHRVPPETRGDLAAWMEARADAVAAHGAEIGHSRYVQVLQVSRLNVIYLLLRLSRSWPVTAMCSVLHGLPVPQPKLFDPEGKREDWDAIEVLSFADAKAARRFLSGAASAGARQALAEDARGHTLRSQAVPMTVTRAFLRQGAAPDAIVTLFCLRARPEVGRAGLADYWLGPHRAHVQGQQPLLGYGWYDQLVAVGVDELETLAEVLSHATGADWDGVASIGYEHMRDIIRGVYDIRLQTANMGLVYDETRFIDLTRSSLMLGRVRLVTEGARQGEGRITETEAA